MTRNEKDSYLIELTRSIIIIQGSYWLVWVSCDRRPKRSGRI